MAKYEVYAEYKDSGTKWLPILPKNWRVERVKRMLFLQRTIVGSDFDQFQLLSLTLRGIIPRDISNGDGKIPESFSTYQQVNTDDLVFCLFDMDETPRTVGISQEKGMITGAYNVYSSLGRGIPKYLYYYFLYLDYFKGLKPFYTGLRKVVRSDTFANIEIPCPSIFEQTQIANFLDHETAKIDSLIEKQQQLIQLLKEKRQAVISHAVTKGLNPNVPMKDSGVEWLGQVPEHWDIKKIKYLGSILNGYAFPSDGFTEEGVRVLKISNIQNMYLDWSDLSFVSEILAKTLAQFSIKKGDLVFALTRPIISSGIKAAIIDIDEKILLNQRNAILRPNELCSKKWLYYMILNGSFVQEFNNQIDKTGQQPNISTTAIGNLAIPVAPIKEQNSIVEYIESKLKVIDRLILKAESAIQLMQERRTALISAAVTGKIDVRNWQNPNNNNEAKTEFSA